MRILSYINYLTRRGDTFDTLAFSVYGDEKKSHLIMKENLELLDVLVFGENTLVRIPIFEEAPVSNTAPPWRRRDETAV